MTSVLLCMASVFFWQSQEAFTGRRGDALPLDERDQLQKPRKMAERGCDVEGSDLHTGCDEECDPDTNADWWPDNACISGQNTNGHSGWNYNRGRRSNCRWNYTIRSAAECARVAGEMEICYSGPKSHNKEPRGCFLPASADAGGNRRRRRGSTGAMPERNGNSWCARFNTNPNPIKVWSNTNKQNGHRGICYRYPNPTASPTSSPSAAPTAPTDAPTLAPSSSAPTFTPSFSPSFSPSSAPSKTPTSTPTSGPTPAPTSAPSKAPTVKCTGFDGTPVNFSGSPMLSRVSNTSGQGCTLNGGWARQIMQSAAGTRVFNFSFVNGQGQGSDIGGALEFTGPGGAVQSCSFSSDVSTNGGALFLSATSAVEKSHFHNNTAQSNGGCIYHDNQDSLVIESSSFTGQSSAGGFGSLLYLHSQTTYFKLQDIDLFEPGSTFFAQLAPLETVLKNVRTLADSNTITTESVFKGKLTSLVSCAKSFSNSSLEKRMACFSTGGGFCAPACEVGLALGTFQCQDVSSADENCVSTWEFVAMLAGGASSVSCPTILCDAGERLILTNQTQVCTTCLTNGSWCPAGSGTQEQLCPQGFVCRSPDTNPEPCLGGFDCADAAFRSFAAPCPTGFTCTPTTKLTCANDGSMFCPAGSDGSNSNLCGEGHFCPNSSSQLLCPPLSFRPEGVHATFCTPWDDCLPGSRVLVSATSSRDRTCQLCQAGQFSQSTNAVACKDCPAGWLQRKTNASRCEPCNATEEEYCPEGSSESMAVSIGYYSWPASVGAPKESQTLCVQLIEFCIRGVRKTATTCLPGEATHVEATLESDRICVTCQPGKMSAMNNSIGCSNCPSGWYQSDAGATECSACYNSAFFCQLGAAEPKSVSAGFYTTPEFASHFTGETLCMAGAEFCTNGLRFNCSNCLAGEHVRDDCTTTQDRTCSNCFQGTFSSSLDSPSCAPCPEGYFQQLPGKSRCENCTSAASFCSSGSIAPQLAMAGFKTVLQDQVRVRQELCAPGEFCVNGIASNCSHCSAGKRVRNDCATTNDRTCESCFSGTFSSSIDSPTCTKCPDGYFQGSNVKTLCDLCTHCEGGQQETSTCENHKNTACQDCGVGEWSPLNASSCYACPAGFSSNLAKQITCIACPHGTFAGTQRLGACVQCINGQYQSSTGQVVCKFCARFSGTPGVERVQCTCNDGFVSEDASNASLDCQNCAEFGVGAFCCGGVLSVREGYWREQGKSKNSPTLVTQCLEPYIQCRGVDPKTQCADLATATAILSNSSYSTCVKGSAGVSCAWCREGFVHDISGVCIACGSVKSPAVLPAVLSFVTLLLAVAAAAIAGHKAKAPHRGVGGRKEADTKDVQASGAEDVEEFLETSERAQEVFSTLFRE